ncbi:hypothetical protein ANCCAN_04826 [Ancylostoma caninum]|uniref:Uncharacterized protein n=1 Tax=Ancylostoma caninum TaxID=29170 RepID=A0A368GXK3_ANCCA|nr:hypothetical protein ANCCAN_04826 [Ancylostoma caninum]
MTRCSRLSRLIHLSMVWLEEHFPEEKNSFRSTTKEGADLRISDLALKGPKADQMQINYSKAYLGFHRHLDNSTHCSWNIGDCLDLCNLFYGYYFISRSSCKESMEDESQEEKILADDHLNCHSLFRTST